MTRNKAITAINEACIGWLDEGGGGGEGRVSESVEKGNFVTKIFSQIIMLNEVLKGCQKSYLLMYKS